MTYCSELPSQIQAVEVLCKVESTCNGNRKTMLCIAKKYTFGPSVIMWLHL